MRASLLGAWATKPGMAPMKKPWRVGCAPLTRRARSTMKAQSASKGWAATGMPIIWVQILCAPCTRVSMTLFNTLSKAMTQATHHVRVRPRHGQQRRQSKEYWEAIEQYHGLQGGFVWEWVDHGIASKANGIDYWAYGGDFGEDIHDLNFVCDGLCWPDRAPHSSLIELKKVLEPIRTKWDRRGLIVHKFTYSTLDHFACRWTLLVGGEPAGSGTWRLQMSRPERPHGLPSMKPFGRRDKPRAISRRKIAQPLTQLLDTTYRQAASALHIGRICHHQGKPWPG